MWVRLQPYSSSSNLFLYLRPDPAVIQESSESRQRFDRGGGALAMLAQHGPLRAAIAALQCADEQRVTLVELLQRRVRGALQFDEPLLAARAEQ